MKPTRITLSTSGVVLLLLSLYCPSAIGGQENGICDLNCPQSAPCAFGEAELISQASAEGTTNIDGMYCLCPPFLTGILCEVPFESCGDGQHVCLHGGICKSGVLYDGNQHLYCDCSRAQDEKGNIYVGKYCEVPLNSDVQSCDENDPSKFCLNGGSCNQQYPSGEPCVCSEDHSGPHCEFTHGNNVTVVTENGSGFSDNWKSNKTVSTSNSCTLQCKNGGTCVIGKNPNATNEYMRYWDDNTPENMYCSCPDTHDGPLCEIERAQCGENFCYYGSECKEEFTEGKTFHHCDCTKTSTPGFFAGRFCQYKATEYCSNDPGLNGHLFCVNQGTCRANPYEGCDCPTGYVGFSCEFHSEDPVDSDIISVVQKEKDEEKEVSCEGGQLLCSNGSKCVNEGEEWRCDCESADSELASFFAGRNCEHPVNDICTEGFQKDSISSVTISNPLPGTPLSFCVNGGRCKKIVQPGESHAGCFCDDGFLGPHCELRESMKVEGPYSQDPYAEIRANGDADEGNTTIRKIFLTLGTVVLVALFAFGANSYRRRRKQRNAVVTNSMSWSSNYRDRPQQDINIAPKRASLHVDVYERATEEAHTRSNRDNSTSGNSSAVASFSQGSSSISPSAVQLLKTEQHLSDDEQDDVFRAPEVDIGPPRDEDGHELHNVDIV